MSVEQLNYGVMPVDYGEAIPDATAPVAQPEMPAETSASTGFYRNVFSNVFNSERFNGVRRSYRYARAVGTCALAFGAAAELSVDTQSAYAQDKSCVVEETADGSTETCTYPDGSTTTETTSTVGQSNPNPLTPNPNSIGGMGSRQELAREVIDLIHAGRIRVEPLKGLHARDMRSGSTPLQNLKSAARGERSDTSARCGNAPHRPGSGEAYINTRILRFLRDLGDKTTFSITAIVGGCHKNGSNHYSGNGVDIGCGKVAFPPRKVRLAERVGRPLGVKRFPGENCAQDAHNHFSTNGR